jgi:hypothetical protein
MPPYLGQKSKLLISFRIRKISVETYAQNLATITDFLVALFGDSFLFHVIEVSALRVTSPCCYSDRLSSSSSVLEKSRYSKSNKYHSLPSIPSKIHYHVVCP